MKTIAIIGSREFNPEQARLEIANRLGCHLNDFEKPLIISGGAKGIDSIAIQMAKANRFKTQEILPRFKTENLPYDVNDYFKRNDLIIEMADKIIALWDGKSAGTKYVIDECFRTRKNIEVIFEI